MSKMENITVICDFCKTEITEKEERDSFTEDEKQVEIIVKYYQYYPEDDDFGGYLREHKIQLCRDCAKRILPLFQLEVDILNVRE